MGNSTSSFRQFKIACRRLGEEGNLLVLTLPIDNEPKEKIIYETSAEVRRAMVVKTPMEARERFSNYSSEVAKVALRLIAEYTELCAKKKRTMIELRQKERPRLREKKARTVEGIVSLPKPQTIGFMDMNYDCRRLVYEALFPDPTIGIWARQPDKRRWDESRTIRYKYPALKVMGLSKTINLEASEVYYGKNFLFTGHRASWVVLDSFLRTIRPQNYQFLRHLTISMPHDEFYDGQLDPYDNRFVFERVERVTDLTISDYLWYSNLSDIWEHKDRCDDQDEPQKALGAACEKLVKFPNLRAIDLVYPLSPIYYPGSQQDLHALRELKCEMPQLRFRMVVLHDTKKKLNTKKILYYEAWDSSEPISLLNMAVNMYCYKVEVDPDCRLAWALDEAPQRWKVHEDSLKKVLGLHKGYGKGPKERDWDGRSWEFPQNWWDFNLMS